MCPYGSKFIHVFFYLVRKNVLDCYFQLWSLYYLLYPHGDRSGLRKLNNEANQHIYLQH